MVKKILITGGLGFIGGHLIEQLVKDGNCEIDVVDSLANNSLRPEDLKSPCIRKVYTCSVEDFDFSDKKYDEIYHLASPVGPAGVLKYAGKMGSMILGDTMKVAEFASKMDAKVIFMSTSEVYGKDPGHSAQHENIEKIVPAKITTRLEYGVAKMLTEICLHNYAKYNNLKYNIIRPFNIVGTGQSTKAGFVIPRFVHAALTNQPITVFGDGKQRRTFTHVKDIVDGLIKVMNAPISGEIYNIGNPANEHSVLDVANMVKACAQSNSEISLMDPKELYGKDYEEAWNKIPDISKINNHVGWSPKYDFKSIVQEIVDDHRMTLSANKFRPNHEY